MCVDHLLMAITLCPPEELNLMADSWILFTIWISVSGRRGWRPLAPILIILEAGVFPLGCLNGKLFLNSLFLGNVWETDNYVRVSFFCPK